MDVNLSNIEIIFLDVVTHLNSYRTRSKFITNRIHVQFTIVALVVEYFEFLHITMSHNKREIFTDKLVCIIQYYIQN